MLSLSGLKLPEEVIGLGPVGLRCTAAPEPERGESFAYTEWSVNILQMTKDDLQDHEQSHCYISAQTADVLYSEAMQRLVCYLCSLSSAAATGLTESTGHHL